MSTTFRKFLTLRLSTRHFVIIGIIGMLIGMGLSNLLDATKPIKATRLNTGRSNITEFKNEHIAKATGPTYGYIKGSQE